MNYEEAREYIDKAALRGSIMGLENIVNLMSELGNVQDSLNVVHIAGTNGKGSVSAYICQILSEAGYKVGRYTSPAVFDYLEIISVNNTSIGKEDYAKVMTKVIEAADNMKAKGMAEPTAFELETAAAYKYFYDSKCDVVIIETGMGGIEDATNVVNNPLVSVITSVSMDHVQYLGDTLEKIAWNKAGIIKRNGIVVTAPQDESVLEVIKNKADMENAFMVTARDMESVTFAHDKTFCRYQSSSENVYDLETCMLGTFQIPNMAVAVEVSEVLKNKGLFIYKENIEAGIKNARWHGRFEKLAVQPEVYFDGGHNPGAAENIRNTLEIYFTNRKIIYIIGVLADKDYDKVLSVTAGLAKHIITITPPDNKRALNGEELLKTVYKYNSNAEYEENLERAVAKAVALAGNDGVVIIFGSLSYLGKIKEIFNKNVDRNGDCYDR